MEIGVITEVQYQQVATIYKEGIATGHATFQTEAPSWEVWDKGHLPSCRIAAFEEEKILGWAALSPVSSRCVYAGVAEVSVYISEAARGKGIGKALLQRLVIDSESEGLWTLQAGIFPENIPSIRLHESCGFRLVGRRERIGNLNGLWRDTILMERRSKTVGT